MKSKLLYFHPKLGKHSLISMNFYKYTISSFTNTLIISVLLILVSPLMGQEEGSLNIRNYSPTEYLQHSQNWAIIQDLRGVMYFGNSNGILEYDGVSWRHIELTNQSIGRSLDMDSSGRIYVGGVDEFGFLKADSSGKMMYHSLIEKVEEKDRKFQDVWFTHCSGNDVYFIANSKIFLLHDGEIQTLKPDINFGPCITLNNKTFIHVWDKGIQQFEDDSLVDIPHGDFFKKKAVWFYLPWSETEIMVATMNSGLFIYDISNNKTTKKKTSIRKFKTEVDELLKSKTVYSGCRLLNGKIAVGTLTGGVFIIDERGKLLRRIDKGLRNNKIWFITHDKDDNLWLSTNNGISKIDINSPISFWGIEAGLKSPVDYILRHNDTIFFGGFGGIYYLQNSQAHRVSGITTEAYTMENITSPDDTSQKILLASTEDFGIAEVDHNSLKEIINLSPWDIHQSNKNPSVLYIGTGYGLYIATYEDKQWKLLGNIEGITEDIRFIEEDHNSDIWISTFLNGFVRITPSDNLLKPKNVIRYGLESGLTSLNDAYINLFDNRIIYSTTNGLFQFDKQNQIFVPDTTFGSLYSDGSRTVYNIIKDMNDNIWISGIKNNHDFINVLTQDENGAYSQLDCNVLKILPPMSIVAVYIDSANTAWIGSSEGLFRIKGELNITSKPFETLIRSITAGRDTLYYGTNTSKIEIGAKNLLRGPKPLPYSQNSITFQYASPSFSREKATVYQCWLEGFSEEWSEWSLDTKKEYLNLNQGNYNFHVRSKNIFDTVGSETIYEFRILAPWYQSSSAYVFYVLAFACFIYLIVYLNSKRLKAANLHLESIVKIRTAEVRQQKEEIQVQSDNLQMLNYELSQRNEEIQAQSDQLQMLNTELSQQNEEIQAQSGQLQDLNNKLQIRNTEIEAQRDKLKELVDTKDRFFNIIAHDLRGPFQSLIGLSELLSTDPAMFSPEEIKEFNEALNQSAVSGFALLENLLEWARSQTQHIEYVPKKISVIDLIKDNFQILSGSANNKSIILKSEIDNNAFVFVDKNMVNTVFRNLISNAIKFTPHKGEVTVSLKENETEVSILLKDNGVGIEETDIEKLFKLDTKFTTPGTANEKGTGLGLLLCKEFVEKNNGSITVESEVGKGSTFILTFPRIKEATS